MNIGEVDVVPGVSVGDDVLVLGVGVISIHTNLNTSVTFTEHSPNDSTNGSLLPTALLNTTLSEHCSYRGTDTDPIIFIGLWARSTKIVLEYTTPVSLHCIVTVAFSGASPVHSNITCHDYDEYYRTSIFLLVYQRKQWHYY